jgi:hypothetical protein
MYGESSGKSLRVRSHKSPTALVRFGDQPWDGNEWCYTLQGIDPERLDGFCGYVASFEFRRGQKLWRINPASMRIGDPFRMGVKRGVDTTILLPQLVSHGKSVLIREPAGLLLQLPKLEIADV